MKTRILFPVFFLPLALFAASSQILGWNNLGMHCMDSDYSVFSILPPYNTIDAQLIVAGKLVTNGSGYTVTYQAIADTDGSINKSSVGKGNWQQYAALIYGGVAPDQGLPFPGPASFWMPGSNNVPQPMLFEATNQPAPGAYTPVNWFYAYGIPITPYDDSGKKNPYPMMRLIAKNSSNQAIATNDIVLPVSDEMDCRACHASGSQTAAQPAAGWVWSGIQERDFRLNILRLHDEHQFARHNALYQEALAARGFNPQGLFQGVVADGKPVLCAACHASEALAAPSYGSIPQLTTSIHSAHAGVMDPVTSLTLNNTANRSACYRCHPGSATKCLRGAMGGAIASDGSMSMQCQSCHGSMTTVGSNNRVGWFMEPNCQSCHTGTAVQNNGQIRYTSSFTNATGGERIAVNQTFATQPNTPANGISLFRFSRGHGGLQCEACHGSTHAEFPATHANDNVRNQKIQGHAGVMVECTACHASMSVSSTTAAGGPHGMHPIGASWVSAHHDYINGNLAACQACHGTDYRGTVLSRAQDSRQLIASFDGGVRVTNNLFRGALVGCYNCHNGSGSSSPITTPVPTVEVVSGTTPNHTPLNLPVAVTPASATLRIISQPAHGSLGLNGKTLTYFPETGYVGADQFTYAAWNGTNNSVLATGLVNVVQGPYSFGIVAHVPTNSPVNWPVAFAVVPTVTNYSGPVAFSWNFGDGTPGSTNQFPTHGYVASGTYNWNVTATASNLATSASGSIAVTGPASLNIVQSSSQVGLVLPDSPSIVIEESTALGANAQWKPAADLPPASGGVIIYLPVSASGAKFYRVRQAW